MRPVTLSLAVTLSVLLGVGAIGGAILFVAVAVGLGTMGGGALAPILFVVVGALLAVGVGLLALASALWRRRAGAWPVLVALHGLVAVGVAVAAGSGGWSWPLVAGLAIASASMVLLVLPQTRAALEG